jgi:hypothetical protein
LSGVLFLLTFCVVGGCNKANNSNVNFTIDLNQSQFNILHKQLWCFGVV